MMPEEQELENGPWVSEEVACLNCGHDQTFLKPSRPISRMQAMGLLSEALGMLQNSNVPLLSHKNSPLNVVVSYFPNEVDARL